ncbi:hypothetical protein KSF_010560 [Reticulibacter mediterranei]|uniref:HTH cro/C1-type domain-containing protein n=1 Tax=Reticulibacter mediterranei TaxID=2778369 RepID=A0A8J3ICF8_9CHLR|nr:helix-turn-helix transcriptional regulator [Reticulibacter mediterranei]GHO91008.1 hypothetical protein KSF_010560 [Reticulibacter mediterranei]
MYRLKVKEVAAAKGFSQRQLFLKSGVDIRTVRRIFREPDTVVTTETLDKLATTMGVDIRDLIETIHEKEQQDQQGSEE